jgi:hypothetical protein
MRGSNFHSQGKKYEKVTQKASSKKSSNIFFRDLHRQLENLIEIQVAE